jgi:uncharacterized protein
MIWSPLRWFIRATPLLLAFASTVSAQSPAKIDISKMNPAGLLVDKYSYMAQPYNFYYFHHIDELGLRTDWVRKPGNVYPLKEPSSAFSLKYKFHGNEYSLDDYMQRNYVTGFLVLRDDQIILEKYFHGADQNSRFVSQSVGKSIVSILVGAAVSEGNIHSVEDPVDQYLPYLKSSGYRGVSIRNILEMSTGVDYSEDYHDPHSGAALIGAALLTGKPAFKDFAASTKPTNTKPGTEFNYQSVNTQVLGLLLETVTGKRLNQYAEEKLWKKIGAQSDAFFYEAKTQPDTCAFACFNATLRDYARVGLMMMRGGRLSTARVVPESWVHDSTTPGADYLKPGAMLAKSGDPFGYGYQWWIPPGEDGAFEAEGIYGQSIYVNPKMHVVIVQTSAWPDPLGGGSELPEENGVVDEAIAHAGQTTAASSQPSWWQQLPPYLDMSEPEAIQPFWAKRLTGYVTAQDGTHLRYSVLLPKGDSPFPVVINYSGYDPGAIGGSPYLRNDTTMSRSLDRTLIEHGFAVMGINARGTGCSEGSFDFLGPSYGKDGADAVEWAAKQPWSSGAVGMANWSWAGMSQVATASQRPPHLKAIAPGMVMTDPRLDSWALGGVSSEGFVTGWWDFLHSRWAAVRRSADAESDSQCLKQVDENYTNGEAPSLPSLLLRHPLRDAWIEHRTILNGTEQINVPVLSMESFQDEATTARGGYYQERLDPQRLWLVQTNGNHDLYESLRFRDILVAFLEHFLKGTPNHFENRPHVEVWQETSSQAKMPPHGIEEQAAPSWVVTRENFPPKVEVQAFSLGADGGLSTLSDGKGKPDSYVYPVPGPTVNVGFGVEKWGELDPQWRQGSLVYTSAPLASDLVTYGPASADLWVSSTVDDADLQVTLTEVRPDGQELFVQRGWLRLSDRTLDETRSTPLRPMLLDSPESITALQPNIPVLGRVELTKFSYAFRQASRLRIWIDAPSATGGNSFNSRSMPATNMIWHDADHPSRLVLGILPDVKVPVSRPACGTVMMQPCRVDPLPR